MRMPPSRATAALVVVTGAAYILEVVSGQMDRIVALGGFVPARVSGLLVVADAVPVWLTPLTSALLHGGLIHLAFNMVLLAYCAKALEAVLGAGGLILLYVVGAFAAAAAQYVAGPTSVVPMIGASGATSAVVAGYAIFYGERRVTLGHPQLSRLVNILWLAAGWIGVQLLVALATLQGGLAIAVAAHIGGFVAGLVLAQPLLRWRYRNA